MRTASLVGEPGARRASPFLLLLVILTFFLVFAGVSCNTTAAKSAVQSLGGSAGLNTSNTAVLNACLNSLSGVNFVTYSGWELVTGRDPDVNPLPEACDRSGAAPASVAHQANIGAQLLAILGLVSLGLAFLVAVAGFLDVLKGRNRALVTAIFGAGAGILLVLDQVHIHDVLASRIDAAAGTGLSGLSASSFIDVNPGSGLLIALVILAVAVAYNLVASIAGAGPVPVATPEPPELPPPAPLPP